MPEINSKSAPIQPSPRSGSGIAAFFLWAVIPAAFIGPGTVTTCARAGAVFGAELLWALSFSVAATITLQLVAARITVLSGRDLLSWITRRSDDEFTWFGCGVAWAVVFGCAAYQAGNLLGAVHGLQFMFGGEARIWAVLVGALLVPLLLRPSNTLLSSVMGALVALLGITFFWSSSKSVLPWPEVFEGAVRPHVDTHSLPLVLGLIGTTVVPYNIFLGSGLARGQRAGHITGGIICSVLVGGFISAAILLTGTELAGEFSLIGLREVLEAGSPGFGGTMFGLGLFAAGFSSALTAPVAAGLVAQGLMKHPTNDPSAAIRRNRDVRFVLLLVGTAFGVSGAAPVPVILIAQALNGVVLPALALAILYTLRRAHLSAASKPSRLLEVALIVVVLVTMTLGGFGIYQAGQRAVAWIGS